MNIRALVLSATLLVTPAAISAQGTGDSLVFRRALRLIGDGDTTASRALLDSLVAATPEGSARRADALYWRAIATADVAAVKRDLVTISVEYARFPRAADALLRLGKDAYNAGDRKSTIAYLDRLVLEHASSNAAGDAWFWLGRARVDEGSVQLGCEALDSAQQRLPVSDVERRRQVAFYAQPCRALARGDAETGAASSGARGASPPSASGASRGTASASASASASAPRRWSAQVAVYKARKDAERLVQTLKTRGYEARVDSLEYFHVRIGAFDARSGATAVVTKLRAQNIKAIVVEVVPRGP